MKLPNQTLYSNSRPDRTGHQRSPVALIALLLAAAIGFPSRMLANTTETQITSDAAGASALISTTNWTPATAVAPTNTLATTYDYVTATTLRTPQNQNAYTVYANSLTLNTGGALGCKGSNVITIPNLILNGGRIANSGTSGNPDMARVAGTINFQASSSLAVNGAGTVLNVLSVITNSGSSTPILTCSSSGTVVLSSQNTFTGTIVVNNTATASTILQLGANNATPSSAMVQLSGGGNAGPSRFDLNGFNTTVANLNITSGTVVGFVTNSAAATTSTLTIDASGTVSVNNGTITDNPSIAGTVAVTKLGTGTLSFNTAEGYHGSTTIGAGTLAVGASGSISNSQAISIAAAATLDVSAIDSYTLTSTSFSASGTGTTMGVNAAAINGASSVSLGAQLLHLTYTPTTFTGDANDVALLIAQGGLTLNNNSFTVNNASGTPLGAGTYVLVQVTSGNITENGSPAYALTVTGSGLAAQTTAAIVVSGGNVNLVVTANANPTPTFSNLTASHTVTYGTPSVTLSGKVSAPGPIYAANGEPITVSINGNLQATTIQDNAGDFSISYNLSGLPASATPYTITYSYGGDSSLGSAANTNTTLTVQPATPAFSGLTASQTVSYGTADVILGGKVSAGSVYPALGEMVVVSINGNPQTNTISDATGDFSFSYNLLSIPFNAASYTITYSYYGDPSLNSAADTSTTLTVETNTITENLPTTDALNTSSLNTSNFWLPATTVFPTSPLATNYDFVVTGSLRTPTGGSNYTVYGRSLTINAGGFLTFKGYGVVTVSNLLLNGGAIKNAVTGGTPDESLLAGTINLTASSSLTPNGASTSVVNIESVITNSPAINPAPTLTCSGGGTVILSAQNTFSGNVVVSGASAEPTILQLGANNALPTGTSVTLNGATGSSSPGVLDLNGFGTTIASLTFPSTGPNRGYVTNSALGTTGTLTLGQGNASETLQYGTITDNPSSAGTVALAKIGTGTLTVDNTVTYSGDTMVSAGTLALGPNGSIPNSAEINIAANATFDASQTFFILGASQTLTGSGSVNGSMQADGTIAPVGALTFTNDLTINGNLRFTVNKSLAKSNDVAVVGGGLYNSGNGTLRVINHGPLLVVGDTFTLFNQPLNNGDSLTILPPPGVTLSNLLSVNGSLKVLSSAPPPLPYLTSISLSGTNVVINGTNGLAGEEYLVLASTNVALPLSQWAVLSMGTLSASVFSLTNTVEPGAAQTFYRLKVQ